MRKVMLDLETTTPIFLNGADRTQPELRAPSFRGALRFWFRAMMGGVFHGDPQQIEKVSQLESAVFGNTISASPVQVRVSATDFSQDKIARVALLPHKEEIDPKRAGLQDAIVNVLIKLELSQRRGDWKALEMVTWSALLLATMGAIGKRARRGYGSIAIESMSCGRTELPIELHQLLETRPVSGEALHTYLKAVLTAGHAAFEKFAIACDISPAPDPARVRRLPEFSVLLRDTRVVVLRPPNAPDVESLLVQLMEEMSKQKRQLGETRFANSFGSALGQRRASPLWVRVHKAGADHYLVFIFLKAKISASSPGNQTDNQTIVEDFLTNLPADKWE